ncbi:hypothetical protein AXF42_Ash003439 [Apostasia shenzhenica]|uniref:Fungal lipase-type domain-containing protein n=1 Tax=Apostasia shenzhenica TaxID=1088818 RepID=A0A2I0BG46_9ASPA|nr:hypothetical protein AXF42_Ash003439 [Apostasia shenzhenica]
MFTVEEVDGVLYVAFSGVQCLRSMNGGLFGDGFFSAVPLSSAGARALFAPLVGEEGGGEMVIVQACVLQLFLSVYGSSELQMLAKEVNDKEVIFTGHSIGGSLAALVTLNFLCSSMSLTSFEPSSLLCVTFGSPLLGNEALSQVILRERWTGKFCHVVSQHDFLPRLLFCPQHSFAPQMTLYLLEPWRFSNVQKAELHQFITSRIATLAMDQKLSLPNQSQSLFMPFGCYALCSTEGIVCIDNPVAVIRMLCLTFVTGSPKYAMEEKLSYGDLVTNIQLKLLKKKMVNIGDGFFDIEL